jgi:hypothetical protein
VNALGTRAPTRSSPRHIKVIVTDNNWTKLVLVGLIHGGVKIAVGLGGWRVFLPIIQASQLYFDLMVLS